MTKRVAGVRAARTSRTQSCAVSADVRSGRGRLFTGLVTESTRTPLPGSRGRTGRRVALIVAPGADRPRGGRAGALDGSLASGEAVGEGRSAMRSARRLILPLALAQFICSFAGSNMNVMINDISEDLDTTVKGVQTAITLFLLIMAILMIPCSKLTDRWGRKRCFIGGLTLYGIGALMSAVSPNLGVLILGNSVFEGVGTAFLIPPVYILATIWFSDLTSRAWAFGVISGLGGIGAAAGPLIGGVITTAISWRVAFLFQAAGRRDDHRAQPPHRRSAPGGPDAPFDAVGAILSGVGMFCLVFGILRPAATTRSDGDLPGGRGASSCWPSSSSSAPGATREGAAALDRALQGPDLQPRPRHAEHAVADADGDSFAVSVFLQEVRGYSAIKTGVVFTAATLGILASSLAAERLAKRYPQRTLIVAGFVVTLTGSGCCSSSSGRRRASSRSRPGCC